jgi:hypothetical protein
MRVKSSLFLCVSLFVAACGGSKPPAEEPSAPAASDKADAKEDADASADDEKAGDKDKGDKAAKAKDAKKEESSSDSSSTSGPKPTRTPRDILTAPDVIFMFSFNQSDLKDQAEKQCDAQVKDNPKKRAECITKAKAKMIDADGMSFKQEKGSWYWLVIKRKGKTLINIHKLPVEFTKEDDHSVVLKPTGKDEGKSPGTAPGETKVEVPNEYEIVIQDSKLGKMVYEAKIGLTGG